MDFMHAALLVTQVGSLPGRSTEFALLYTRAFWHAATVNHMSSSAICVDLVAAFYTTVKQLALRLPRDEDSLAHALETMEICPFLANGVRETLLRPRSSVRMSTTSIF